MISGGEIKEVYFPPKASTPVKESVLKYQKEPEEMRETENYIKLPPID